MDHSINRGGQRLRDNSVIVGDNSGDQSAIDKWDSFLDQYLVEKRSIEKQKLNLPIAAKITAKTQTISDKKQRNVINMA